MWSFNVEGTYYAYKVHMTGLLGVQHIFRGPKTEKGNFWAFLEINQRPSSCAVLSQKATTTTLCVQVVNDGVHTGFERYKYDWTDLYKSIKAFLEIYLQWHFLRIPKTQLRCSFIAEGPYYAYKEQMTGFLGVQTGFERYKSWKKRILGHFTTHGISFTYTRDPTH